MPFTKPDTFCGRQALVQQRGKLTKRLLFFTVDDPQVVLLGRETIHRNGKRAGWLTSGGFGYTVGKPIVSRGNGSDHSRPAR